MNAPDCLNLNKAPQEQQQGFFYLTNEKRDALTEGERYEHDECCGSSSLDYEPMVDAAGTYIGD